MCLSWTVDKRPGLMGPPRHASPDAPSRFSSGRDQTLIVEFTTRPIPHEKLSSGADFSFHKDQSCAVLVEEQVDSEKFPVLARLPTPVWPPTVLRPAAPPAPHRHELPDELTPP